MPENRLETVHLQELYWRLKTAKERLYKKELMSADDYTSVKLNYPELELLMELVFGEGQKA